MLPVLELRDITKRFPGVLANDHIDLTLNEGEVLALLGENGAGKTTLMNILYGLYKPDEGEIFIRGKRAEIHDPNDAIGQGIGMVHQHFMLVPVFTVTENVMLGVETLKSNGLLDRPAVATSIRDISSKFGLEVEPDATVEDLPVGLQQRVEIIKILYRKAEILILDEPTAVLTPQESEELFKIIRSLVAQGKSVIFISHKLKEVLAISNWVSVLRAGQVVGTVSTAQADERTLARMMVGREVILKVDRNPPHLGDVVLEVRDLTLTDEHGREAVKGVSFDVQAGEVLGVAGVQGNGQTQLVEALAGLRKVSSGTIRIQGHDTTHAGPRQVVELGTAHIPEDRQRDGLVLTFPVADNLVLNTYHMPPFARGPVLQHDAIERAAEERVDLFDVRTPSVYTPASNLSGGNQQKVIVAREFSRPIKLLIASQPTRGLDVGSIEYIHGRIMEKRDQGCAIVLVSPELDEILNLSDRNAVMYDGKILAILPAGAATKEALGLLMAGIEHGVPSPAA